MCRGRYDGNWDPMQDCGNPKQKRKQEKMKLGQVCGFVLIGLWMGLMQVAEAEVSEIPTLVESEYEELGNYSFRELARKGSTVLEKGKRCSKLYDVEPVQSCSCISECFIYGDPYVVPFDSDCAQQEKVLKRDRVHKFYEVPGLSIWGLVKRNGRLDHVKAVFINANEDSDFTQLRPVMMADDDVVANGAKVCEGGEEIKGTVNTKIDGVSMKVSYKFQCWNKKTKPKKPPQVVTFVQLTHNSEGDGATHLSKLFKDVNVWVDKNRKQSVGVQYETAPKKNIGSGWCVERQGQGIPYRRKNDKMLYFQIEEENDKLEAEIDLFQQQERGKDNNLNNLCKRRLGNNGHVCSCKSNCHAWGDPHIGVMDRTCNGNKCEFMSEPVPNFCHGRGCPSSGPGPYNKKLNHATLVYEIVNNENYLADHEVRGFQAFGIVNEYKAFTKLVFRLSRTKGELGQKAETFIYDAERICKQGPKKKSDPNVIYFPPKPFADPNLEGAFALGRKRVSTDDSRRGLRKTKDNGYLDDNEIDLGGVQAILECEKYRGKWHLNVCIERVGMTFLLNNKKLDRKTYSDIERDVFASQGACLAKQNDCKKDPTICDDFYLKRYKDYELTNKVTMGQWFGENSVP